MKISPLINSLLNRQSALWELDDLMASEKMIHDIRKHFNVGLFNLVYQQKQGEDYFKQSVEWFGTQFVDYTRPFGLQRLCFV